jgi:alpha-beta hydrolase superfamily lysophospholipase
VSILSRSAIRRPEVPSRVAVLNYPVRTFRRFCWPEAGSDVECPDDYDLSPELFETVTDDGLTIRGWIFVPDRPWGVVVVCHARSASKSRTLRQVKLLHQRGLAAVTFDFRGCGESDPAGRHARSSLWGPLGDLDAVTGYVDRHLVGELFPAHRVALLGCSFGGNMVLAYAGATKRTYPAIVLDSTPLVRWQTMLGAQLERERRMARHQRTRAAADRLVVRGVIGWTRAEALYRHARHSAHNLRDTAALLIVGERDTLFDIEESQRFLRGHYAGEQHIWRVPRGRHLTNHLVEPEHYADRVADLLAAAFDRAGGRGRPAGSDLTESIAIQRNPVL